MPWPEASHFIINIFVKLSVTKMRVVHKASLGSSNNLVAFLAQENDSCFNNCV